MDKSFDGLRRVIGKENKSIRQDPAGTGGAGVIEG